MDSTTLQSPSTIDRQPLLFNDFFEMGLQDNVSPFLTPDSRTWGADLTLKASSGAGVLLVIAFILSRFPEHLSLSHFFLIFVYFLAGIPSLIESIEDLARFDINIDVLMTLAAFSSVLIGSGMEGGLLLVLFSLSGAMEDAVTAKAKNAISSLHKLSPTKATVFDSSGALLERSVKDILPGMRILVKSGQVVPLDGTVIEGASSVNLSHLTGENFPQTKICGDQVPAGARNLEGSLTLVVTHTTADSTLTRIIRLVTTAQESRPNLQRWFDKLSRGYALSIIGASALFALFLPHIIAIPYLGQEGSLYRALTFLIAASPCALIIAIPIAYLSAVSVCAKQGILLKGGITLDALAGCRAVAFDKTGTLTTGELIYEAVEGLHAATPEKSEQALQIAYALEKNAVHPIAKAISNVIEKLRPANLAVKDFIAIPGFGLEGTVMLPQGECRAFIGHAGFIAPKLSAVEARALTEAATAIQKEGELLAVLLAGSDVFLFRFRDKLRPKIKSTLQLLLKRGLRLVMLTGDHAYNAQRIATEAGLQEYHADLRPEDKLDYVSRIAEEEGLAMVGDGVNDAPALARATVGICMGKVGSTAAIDAADVVLLNDNIELLDWLIAKAHKTKTIVKQNITLATLAIICASLPALAGFVPLWLAVIMHEGGTVLVGLNALRLLRK